MQDQSICAHLPDPSKKAALTEEQKEWRELFPFVVAWLCKMHPDTPKMGTTEMHVCNHYNLEVLTFYWSNTPIDFWLSTELTREDLAH